jgi:hypothetical protein
MLYQSFSSFYFASDIRMQRLSTRVVFASFWFIVVIFISTYIANLTVLISPTRFLKKPAHEISDLYNELRMRIYTYESLTTDLQLGYPLLDKSKFKTTQFQLYDRSQDSLDSIMRDFLADSAGLKAIILEAPMIDKINSLL